MNEIIEIVRQGTPMEKALFLMVCGLVFVFSIQVIFYLIIRLWPKKKKEQ